MNKVLKSIGLIVITFVLLQVGVVVMAILGARGRVYSGTEYMDALNIKGTSFFSLKNIGEYEEIEFSAKIKDEFFDKAYSSVLTASYKEDEFNRMKDKLINESKANRQELIELDSKAIKCIHFDFNNYDSADATGIRNPWDFYIYDFSLDYNNWYNDYGIVAFNDDTKEIAYLQVNDISDQNNIYDYFDVKVREYFDYFF